MNTLQKMSPHQHVLTKMAATALALALAGCGGGGGGSTDASATPQPTPAQTTAALQGIWQSPTGAASSITAIVLPDGQLWSVVSDAGGTRLVKAKLAVQTTGFGGGGKSYILGSSSATGSVSATATATVTEKTSLSGTITTSGSQPEAYALAYQSRYDTPAALADFIGNWQATLGPGTVNWSISSTGVLTGTRTTGCTYTGQLSLRTERKAVVDAAVTENCSGTLTQLQGVAAISANQSHINMAMTTIDEVTAVVLSLGR